ncbi:hypothetical protein RRG08_006454 [Elysia crispata]|uniref:Uncharacterized protein n=1 Tax=Elysia crispata TaxID=231223 RepID=A0AAE1DHT4_9GAST|nr:hypothetical protein RRG08_006454 [Elysia crispata]
MVQQIGGDAADIISTILMMDRTPLLIFTGSNYSEDVAPVTASVETLLSRSPGESCVFSDSLGVLLNNSA